MRVAQKPSWARIEFASLREAIAVCHAITTTRPAGEVVIEVDGTTIEVSIPLHQSAPEAPHEAIS